MGPLILGIVLLMVHAYVAIPPPLDVIVLIVGVVALVYGLYILLTGFVGRSEPVTRYHRRYWY